MVKMSMLKKTILIPEIHKENYSFGKVIRGLSKVRFKTKNGKFLKNKIINVVVNKSDINKNII